MSPEQQEIASALATCSFLPGSFDKKLCNDLSTRAAAEKDLSPKQEQYLRFFLYKYRKQIPNTYLKYQSRAQQFKPE